MSAYRFAAIFALAAGFIALGYAATPLTSPASQPATATTSQPAAQTDTPENSIRTFLHAMYFGEKALGEASSFPADGRDILWNPPIPKEQRAQMEGWLRNLTFKRFIVGDTFKLPGGKSVTFTEQWINADKQQILADKMPIPFNVERQPDGRWLVDPNPMIISRKIAARLRAKAAATALSQPATNPN